MQQVHLLDLVEETDLLQDLRVAADLRVPEDGAVAEVGELLQELGHLRDHVEQALRLRVEHLL